MLRPAPRSTLFPYTTLLRSYYFERKEGPSRNRRWPLAAGPPSIQLRPSRTIAGGPRSEEHTPELQSRLHHVCPLLLEKKNYAPDAPTLTSSPEIPPVDDQLR